MLDKTETAIRIAFNTHDLREAFNCVRHAISKEETRYYPNGVFMHYDAKAGGFYFVATDGRRLARALVKIDDSQCDAPMQVPAVILPASFIAGILKATSKRQYHRINYYMTVTRDRLTYPNPETETLIEAQPVDGTYPDYLRVIPRGDTFRPMVDRKAFLKACKALTAACEAVDTTPCLRLHFEYKTLKLSVLRDSFTAQAAVDLVEPVKIDASKETEFQTSFNGRYLVDALAVIQSNAVTLRLTDPDSPAIIAGEHDPALHILMPMRF